MPEAFERFFLTFHLNINGKPTFLTRFAVDSPIGHRTNTVIVALTIHYSEYIGFKAGISYKEI